jgi:lipopolysaccharide/colanic/teichoic acid biosynthesis glycosyltransferase
VKRPSLSYRTFKRDLEFALQAGDEIFAPALKLLIDEAILLARESHTLTPQVYQLRLTAVKSAFQVMLRMETTHPVAQRIQARFRSAYQDSFWNFLEGEKQVSKPTTNPKMIYSDGNIDKYAYFFLKRALDIVCASVLLVIFAPVMLVIAVLIKLSSPGPVFFVQERVGASKRSCAGLTIWEIRNFQFYKFRSMYQNADQTLHKAYIERWVKGQAEDSGDPTARFKLTGDPRITPLGHILRKTSLDELPQLFNVLKGEMSLVGPRPVPVYEVNQYKRQHYERLAALPGITGLWQVKGRGHVPFEEQIQLDIEYIRAQSLVFDVKLMFLTIPAVLLSRGAK